MSKTANEPIAYMDILALHAALDQQRQSRNLSWRDVAHQIGTSPSTISRLGIGQRPDLDNFARMVTWLGVSADTFVRREGTPAPDFLVSFSALLRAQPDLSPYAAKTIEDMMRMLYSAIRFRPGDTKPDEGERDA